MSENPKISIIAPAYRTAMWMRVYNSMGHNDVSFELIFVGPNEPKFKLPDNFRFIKSNVKPVQCAEIAIRNTKADLIMNIADDMEFKTERPLDKLYNTYKSYNDDKLILSCLFNSPEYHLYPQGCPTAAYMPVAGLMSKKLYRDVGGADRNFMIVNWDLDVVMRICTLGGYIVLSDVRIVEFASGGTGWNIYDKQLLQDLWLIDIIDGKIHYNRTRPVEPFSNDKILEESQITDFYQGPKGKWT